VFLHFHIYVSYLRLSCSSYIHYTYVQRSLYIESLSQINLVFSRICFLFSIAQSGLVSPNQGPARRPMRDRLEEHLDHLNIWGEAGGIVWVNPSSKCASCHSNETDQRNIHTHVNVSLKAYVYDETIYNCCARARFAGCTFLRHIILALNTVYDCTLHH
jgi:hypothetical protein